MAKLHQKIRDMTECYLRIQKRQAPETELANLKLSAMSCRDAVFLQLNAKRHLVYRKKDEGKNLVIAALAELRFASGL